MPKYVVLSIDQVISLHEAVIFKNELQGLARDKSIDSVLNRVNNRLQYGFISDVFDLAACYATFIAKGHCFQDANQRTAVSAAYFILEANQIQVDFSDLSLGNWIIDIARGEKTEVELASWLRQLS
jgi:death-on-curing protein